MKQKVKSSTNSRSGLAAQQNSQPVRHNPTSTRAVKKTLKKKKISTKALSRMNVDDFMSTCLDDSDSSGSEVDMLDGTEPGTSSTNRVNGKSFIDSEAQEGEEEMDDLDSNESSDDDYENEEARPVTNGLSFIDKEAIENYRFDHKGDLDESESDYIPTEVDEDDDKSDEDNASDDGDQSDDDNVSDDGDQSEESVDVAETKGGNKDYADISREDEEDDIEDDDTLSASVHKKSLQKLQNTDPEFYKFLQDNDRKLLQFNESDSDADGEEMYHKPEDDLEVGSDDDEEETEDSPSKADGVITLRLLREWQEKIQTERSITVLADVFHAFHAALNRVTGDDEPCKYKVEGSSVFNAVVQLCVLELQPAVARFLKLPAGAAGRHLQPEKCRNWNKIKSLLKSYLLGLLKLISGVSSPHIVAVLLKHLHQMSQFVACFPNIMKKVLKHLITIWGSGEETARVIAFLCILRLANNQHSLLDGVVKKMYLTYVSNAKFTSPNTLPSINFMRRSLLEICVLDETVSYQHVFLYIRQLAIHLRNAITLQKKESVQAVLNWQFVHSLHLWADLLAVNKLTLQPLLYPLVQVIMGTVKLIPTTQYFPLRFHCTQMLIHLSNLTHTFIPVLPFLLEVLSSYDFNRRHKKASMKPMDLTCVLRVTKVEQSENSFKDAIIEIIYQQILEYLANEAHTIGFPDIVVSTTLQLRTFLKTCKVSNYCKKMRSLVDKMEENSRFIEKERKGFTLMLNDRKAVDAWETNVKLKGPPLANFYASFKAVYKQVVAKRATDNEKLGAYDIPVLKKRDKKVMDNGGPVELFPSDTDSDLDLPVSSVTLQKKKKKSKKVKAKAQVEVEVKSDDDTMQEDVVQDLNMDDF